MIDDYNNLLASIELPVVILDANRHIRMFTPAAAEIFNLIPADEGRPLAALKIGGEIDGLEQKVAEVIEKASARD